MNSHQFILCSCFLFLIFFSCTTQPITTDHIQNGSPMLVSDVYKPHSFLNDDRAEKIKGLAPEIHALVEEYMKDRKIPGVAYGIVVDDKLVVASATGLINLEENLPATTKSAFRIASMSKSFTALAIVKLRDEGKLSLSDPVAKYIPEMAEVVYPTLDAAVIDIENLLTMTAGFPEDNPWGDRQLDEPDQMLIDLIKEGVSFSNPPSYQYEYSNTGYAMLGKIISQASGMPYQEYIRENIFKPLGMDNTHWEFEDVPAQQLVHGYRWEDEKWKPEPMLHDGSFGAMGGLITTIEDFSKYVSLHLSAWPPGNEPENGPVKRSSLREMHTPTFARLYANAMDYNGEPCPMMSGYGYGLGIVTDCHGIKSVSHGGALPGFGSNYTFFPEYGVGIMAFGNLTYTSPWPLSAIKKLLFESGIKPRELPASDILMERQKQVTELIQSWNPELETKILAENFYPDRSREKRMAEIKEVLDKAGAIRNSSTIRPQNQLRGSFQLEGEKGIVNVYFTLTPEKEPKVQHLSVSLEED